MSLKLAPRKILPTHIDPKKLGYIRPNRTIKFISPEIALEYAKNSTIKALKATKPFERCILINKDIIVKEIDGGADYVEFNTDGIEFDTMVHGHPDGYKKGCTHPINFQDIAAFFENVKNGIKKSIVYNTLGEYSMVEALPEPEAYKKLLPIVRKRFLELQNQHNLARSYKLSDAVTEATMNRILELKRSGNISKIAARIPDENFFETLMATIEIPILHEALEKNAKELKLSYKTNFSNLEEIIKQNTL